MDQHIFEQLDALERGTRDERTRATMPWREGHGINASQWPGRSGSEAAHDYGRSTHRQVLETRNEYAGQPMDVDSFGENIHDQHDRGNRNAQLLVQPRESCGRARQPQRMARYDHGPSRSMFNEEPPSHASSSPSAQHWLSSPTSRAIRRPEVAIHYGRDGHMGSSTQAKPGDSQYSRRKPFTAEQMDAENHNMQIEPAHLNVDGPATHAQRRKYCAPNTTHGCNTPIVRGVQLVSTRDMPDSFRSIFPFPLFNVIQSKSFDTMYRGSDNFVLSSPTGSGKTVILELAICHLINTSTSGSYKIVYQAPTKSLCAERQRDWQAKFGPLGLQCAELTGDTEGGAQLRNVQNAIIIITTPEKWDSMTRKWKDHQKLMLMVKLFLIDEVHILKEDRGATLEAVVSRMKSVESNVRFVALSATVPNSEDIATWLGQDHLHQWLPAAREVFDESYRPVPLQKYVCGYPGAQNEFAFEKILTAKLTEVIRKYSHGKPIIIFCFTRNSCAETARVLAEWWTSRSPAERHWSAPRHRVTVSDKALQDTVSSGVAFHHAGLRLEDRTAVEKAYLSGEVKVICCTSTLAVGVNLPCHMVIVKHTVSYGGPRVGCKEYSDLEVMQMLGRAGRPQFDDSAVAVIMTRALKVPYYEKMITGTEVLESCLHLNLIDHLNSEIGLGTITSAATAKKWLKGTFLYVRLKENPKHYKIDGSIPGRTLDERLENICHDRIAALETHDLVQSHPKLHCTDFGDAMARYYLQFGTMKILLSLQPHSKVSEILSVIAQATEFGDIRFRANEKPTYKELNKNNSIKFPIPVNLDSPAHKVSLIIQSVLGAVELPTEDPKQKNEYANARSHIFQHAIRFTKCIIDCQLHLEDSITVCNALMLSRSLGAQVWDDSPIHMKQLDAIGIVSVRKLAAAQIKSIEELEDTEAHRIETILSRNPPFGTQILASAKIFPKLRVSLKCVGEPLIKKGEHITVRLNVEIGFLNETVPEYFNRRPVYVCMLAERSDGQVVHFARASAKNLSKGQEILINVSLMNTNQSVRAYVMCDELAGTMRYATLKPDVPASAFPATRVTEETSQRLVISRPSNRRAVPTGSTNKSEEFGDAGIDDADLAFAEGEGFESIDDFDDDCLTASESSLKKRKTTLTSNADVPRPRQLANGKWACNHACKDKTSCKHMCCREGLERQPKPRATKKEKLADPIADPKQTQLKMRKSKDTLAGKSQEAISTASPPCKKTKMSQEAHNLSHLHESVQGTTGIVPMLGNPPLKSHGKFGKDAQLSFLSKEKDDGFSDYSLDSWNSDDLPEANSLLQQPSATHQSTDTPRAVHLDDDYEMLGLLDNVASSRTSHEHGILDRSSHAPVNNMQDTSDQHAGRLGAPTNPLRGLENDVARPVTKAKAKRSPPLFLQSTSSNSVPPTSSPRNTTISSAKPGTFPKQAMATSLFGTPIPKLSIPESSPIVQEGYLPTNDDATTAAGTAAVTAPENDSKSDIQPVDDALEAWFKQEFGTELFNYIG